MITLAILAILFVPMMQLFSHALYSAADSGDLMTAINLVEVHMEKIKNLSLTKAQLKEKGDQWTPKLDEPPLEMNKAKWRVLSRFQPDTDPLEVNVEVYLADNLTKPVTSLATLIEDNLWLENN